MGYEGRKEQRQTVPYKTNMSEQLHMAVIEVNAMVGKSSRPRHMSVSHSMQAQVVKKVKRSQKESQYQNSESQKSGRQTWSGMGLYRV